MKPITKRERLILKEKFKERFNLRVDKYFLKISKQRLFPVDTIFFKIEFTIER